MIKALILKEWYKTRTMFFIALSLTVAVAAYAILMMSRLVELKGTGHLIMIMILKDNTFVDSCRYMPLLSGILIAASQMVPEMSQRRLKLTLHLPCRHVVLMAVMLMTGLVELTLINCAATGMIAAFDSMNLPGELVGRVLMTMLPWYLAGYVAYLFVSAIFLEGTRAMRIVLSLTGVAVMFLFFQQPAMEAFNSIIVLLVIFMCVLTIMPAGSTVRFKEGLYD